MLSKDQKLPLSPYYQLYDIIVPQDNFYRLVDRLIDFDFIREELKEKYSPDMGRVAEDPVRLFKYLFIKMKEDLPDRNLVDRSLTDMSLKRFLGYMPEDKVIDATTLSVFRRQRLTDIDLLDKLLGKTVGLAEELEGRRIPIIGKIDTDLNYMAETIEDIHDHYYVSEDRDSRVGHKSRVDRFGGYKTHIAINSERLVTGALVTSGEKAEGGYLQDLVEQSRSNGMVVETVVGDSAYNSVDNLDYANGDEGGFELISKESTMPSRAQELFAAGFTYNKDSAMMVCPHGQQALCATLFKKDRTDKNGRMNSENVMSYHFDNAICRLCKDKDVCTVGRQTGRMLRVTSAPQHTRQRSLQETPEFKEKYRERYKIEAKNAELKENHHYRTTYSRGIQSMTLQAAMALFVVNIKRIMALKGNDEGK